MEKDRAVVSVAVLEEEKDLAEEETADRRCIKPLAVNAGLAVNFRLDQREIGLFFAVIVLENKITLEVGPIDLATRGVKDPALKIKKCTMQPVPNAEKPVRYRLDQREIGLFFAATALLRVEVPAGEMSERGRL